MSEIDFSYIKPMEVHLRRICKEIIKINEDRKKRNTKHFINVCKLLTDRMKNDAIFKKIFQRVEPSGSYADKTKITEPNEYDALIILKFPTPRVMLSRPGYVTINIADALKEETDIQKDNYKIFVDEEGYLIQTKVLSWLRSLIRRILRMHHSFDNYNIIQSSSGPAVTLTVTSDDGKFSIDLVGAIEFHSEMCWVADRSPPHSGVWNAIPKPIKLNPAMEDVLASSLQKINFNQINQPNELERGERKTNLHWICSYGELELHFLTGKQNMKQLIRIFKKVRDNKQLINLKSYYIKTMFLHQDNKHGAAYWHQPLADLFIKMFDVILQHLRQQHLASFWHNDLNLFHQLKPEQIKGIYEKLLKTKKAIVKNLCNKNPNFIYEVVCTEIERSKLSI